MRAVLFGTLAALAGFVFYAAFGIVTGWIAGYLSFAVGYIIAKMMMIGSAGMGGRRYQWTAVFLTYLAVSMSAVPITLVYQARRKAAWEEQKKAVNLADEQRQLEEEFGSDTTRPVPQRSVPPAPQKSTVPQPGGPGSTALRNVVPTRAQISPAAVVTSLLIIGLASPILELANPIGGVIGLLILMAGIVVAWRITAAKRFEIVGPFRS